MKHRRCTWIAEDHAPRYSDSFLDTADGLRDTIAPYRASVEITGEPLPPEVNFRAAAIIMAVSLSGCALLLTVALVASILGVWRA